MAYRIAFGGIHTESCTFNPVPTTADDFRVLRGDALRRDARYSFLNAYADAGAEFLPLLHAAAIPGGPVAREVYEAFKTEFLARLSALGPVDGLYLDMHGAMNVSGMDDAEGDWIAAARGVAELARSFNELLPIIPLWERYGNNPMNREFLDAPPEGDPIYANASADPFITYLILTGGVGPAAE